MNDTQRPFCQSLWDANQDIFAAILAHPFLRGLSAGTLDEAKFRFYVEQDALYLQRYGQALALLGARAPNAPARRMFCEHAANAVAVEEALHESFLSHWGAVDKPTAPAPSCLLYTSAVLATVHSRPFPEGLAAVLPCYWIYLEVGRHLLPQSSPHPLYQRWIETYAGEAFATVVNEVLHVTETLARSAERDAMHSLFRDSCRFEYMFWDMAWKRESWPLADNA